MREIKFRFWNEALKTWEKTEYMVGEKGFVRLQALPSQFTGLKDKNGKEIYEGDVVCYVIDEVVEVIEGHPRTEPEGQIGCVGFGNGAYFINSRDGNFYSHGEQMFAWSELEIIGNIYEDSDLIKT